MYGEAVVEQLTLSEWEVARPGELRELRAEVEVVPAGVLREREALAAVGVPWWIRLPGAGAIPLPN
jgi:hypothetical protein